MEKTRQDKTRSGHPVREAAQEAGRLVADALGLDESPEATIARALCLCLCILFVDDHYEKYSKYCIVMYEYTV